MKKKLKLIGVILLMFILTLIIVSSMNKKPITYKNYNDIKFIQANAFQAKLGFNKTTKTELTTYYIDNYTDQESIEFINYIEYILRIAKEKYDLNIPQLKVTLTKDNSMSSSYTKVTFNPTSDKAEGIILSAISKKKLPAWLCIGVERFWCNQVNMKQNAYTKESVQDFLSKDITKDLPDIGDLWLVTDFIPEKKSF